MRAWLLALAACTASPRPSLVTTAETSQYLRTGTYDEALRLCHDFARAYPHVACDEIGRTVEDRPLVALRIGTRGPVIYIQAGIHAGEIEGKDAGFAFLRDLLDGKVAAGALDAVRIVFVPVMNPDGHERVSPNNRPNQRGPEAMGFRTNAARLNLNRDYVKADAPETQAVLRVLAADDPVLLVDLHTTDGAKFEQDISVNTAPVAPRGDQLAATAAALSTQLVQRLTELGHLPVGFYPSFIKDDDPTSGFAVSEAPPRFAHFYMGARSRLGVLVETHSWRTYRERAASTYHALQAIVEQATRDAAAWQRVEHDAEVADLALRGTSVPMVWDNGPHTRPLAFRGYAYTKQPSDISGADWIVYDETKPQLWNVPREGYIIDGGFAPVVAAVLDRHGIQHEPIRGRVAVEAFRVQHVTYPPMFEGHARVELQGAWAPETRELDRGAIRVPIDQPHVRLIVQLLDPALPDSLAQWGLFDTVFERKEYMESYVTEAVAREMLAKDPALRATFDAALAADPALAKDPARRLEWFYRRHPAWDERQDLLPVYRR